MTASLSSALIYVDAAFAGSAGVCNSVVTPFVLVLVLPVWPGMPLPGCTRNAAGLPPADSSLQLAASAHFTSRYGAPHQQPMMSFAGEHPVAGLAGPGYRIEWRKTSIAAPKIYA
jgi:hypothetical protein